ncbi:MAG: lysozyme inhibitor LprI family protein [Pseudomonadota bacterium]
MRLYATWAPALATVLICGVAQAQSYDCSKAITADEKAVCASPRLSALDTEMAQIYEQIEECALMGTRGDVQDSQRAFMAQRASCGADDTCLVKLYSDRVADLKTIENGVGQGAC